MSCVAFRESSSGSTTRPMMSCFCAQEFWVPPREPLQGAATTSSARGAGGASTVVGAATAKRAAQVKAEGASDSLDGKPMPGKQYACTWYVCSAATTRIIRRADVACLCI